jgi:glycosyltransferase involved in cell wall biosynthesis
LPLALWEKGLLEKLVTDLYWPADRQWFTSSLGALFSSESISARFRQGLASRAVKVSARAMSAFALMKAFPVLKLNRYKDKVLGRAAQRIALRNGAALFCYSTYAQAAFQNLGKQSPYRFLFQLHPHPQTVRKILLEEIERTPQATSSLMSEYELSLNSSELRSLCDEPLLATGWTVASSYTAKTLAEHGIPLDRVQVVPYGVNSAEFVQRPAPPDAKNLFTIVYVGSLIQRKGLSYLLDAVRLLRTRQVKVVLCGRGMVDKQLLALYGDLDIEFHIGLPRVAMVKKIHEADVFVLPSLAEGFAHVILEAMSAGLPVIATPHTCAPDVIEEGRHGFIVPVRDAYAIAGKLEWAATHRDALAAMGEAAAVQARSFTWERFRAGISKAYTEMIASAA